jgi:hypothetical protein
MSADVDDDITLVEVPVSETISVCLQLLGDPIRSLRTGLVVRQQGDVINLIAMQYSHDQVLFCMKGIAIQQVLRIAWTSDAIHCKLASPFTAK